MGKLPAPYERFQRTCRRIWKAYDSLGAAVHQAGPLDSKTRELIKLGMPSAEEIEELFSWTYAISQNAPFHVGTVEAPHYRRYWIQRRLEEGMPHKEIERRGKGMGFGMWDGNGVIFVSHRGEVYPAGFLPHPLLGNVREKPLSVIYRDSPVLRELRDMDRLGGKCGRCEFRWICGGSRARAYAVTGNYLDEEPYCTYQPKWTSPRTWGRPEGS